MVNSSVDITIDKSGKNLFVVIVAAGTGSRFGSAIPKQFLPLSGRPVVMHAIDGFRRVFPDASILLVLSPSEFTRWENLCREHDFDSPEIVAGGASRTESVGNAIHVIEGTKETHRKITMIHDGARPIVNGGMIMALYQTLDKGQTAIAEPGYAPTDTIVECGEHSDVRPRNRDDFRLVQTPQTFDTELLTEAYRQARAEGYPTMTDDASLVHYYSGKPITVVPGDPNNIKITRPADIVIAGHLLEHPMPYEAPTIL